MAGDATTRIDPSLPPQGYRLTVTPDGASIIGADPAGVFYGQCTLAQLVVDGRVPCVEIEDHPDLLVRGAVAVARDFGISDAIVGLTIVAIGTSAPELATTLIATFRGDRDIAIGNLIGSSTYNLTFILGGALLFAPGPEPLDPKLIAVDLPVMVATALVCVVVFRTGRRVTRTEGILMVAAYLAYLAYLVIVRT